MDLHESRVVSFEEGSALAAQIQVRIHIIRNARIDNVGKSQSCMVSKVRIIWIQKEASTTDPRQGVLFYEVSAKDGYNVQDAFLALAYAHQTPMSRLKMCTTGASRQEE